MYNRTGAKSPRNKPNRLFSGLRSYLKGFFQADKAIAYSRTGARSPRNKPNRLFSGLRSYPKGFFQAE